MPQFGWTRLAYLLLVLTALAVLARTGSPDAETRSLASESPRDEAATDLIPSETMKPPHTGMTRRIEDADSLVDLDGGGPPSVTRGPEREARPPAPAAAPPATPSGEPVPPVFYRPPPLEVSSRNAPAGPVCGDLGRFPGSSRVVFPLDDRFFYSYEDTWGAPRTQGGHEGTDLMAPAGTPEYAVTDGTVVPVAGSNADGWNTLGGYAVMVRADYSVGPVREGDLFYYAHLERESPLEVGTRVRAGQVIGQAGDTGQGPEVTRGLFPAHLHFGWYDATGTRGVVASGAMNPYPLLEWIKANGGVVTGGSDARYCESPRPPPSLPGANAWPAPDAPGVSPDLDTGSDDPRPSPDVRNETPPETSRRDEPAPRRLVARGLAPEDLAPRPRDPRERLPQKDGSDARTEASDPPALEGTADRPGLPQRGPPSPPEPRNEPPTDTATPARERPEAGSIEHTEPRTRPSGPGLPEVSEGVGAEPARDPGDGAEPDRGEDKRDDEEGDKESPKKREDDRTDSESEEPPRPPIDPPPPVEPERTEEGLPPPEPEEAEETETTAPETTTPETTAPEAEGAPLETTVALETTG